jgi:ribosomal protein S18 acetylase RimI-like enzyme
MNDKIAIEPLIRPVQLDDLDAIFSIDHKVRALGKTITYSNLTTERLFTIDRHVGRLAKPVSYVDLIRGDITELLDIGVVAEVDGHVRGFALGCMSYLGEGGGQAGIITTGVITILGVHPDYQRRGIATSLVTAICNRFHEKGMRSVRIMIDQMDKELQTCFEHLGFGVGGLVEYSKRL